MQSLSVAIVDDEPPARDRLRAMLQQIPHCTVIGEARNAEEAIVLLDRTRPDLVLLDVQMPVRGGFEVLESVAQLPTAVIFVTAYDQHAVEAFEVGAVDYLVKPVRQERLALALERARRAIDAPKPAEGAAPPPDPAAGNGSRHVERLAIRTGRRVRFVQVDEIDSLQASGNYIHLHTSRGVQVIRDTMSRMESRLDPQRFIRIHRSTIVNIQFVREIEPHLHGDYFVRMKDGRRLTLSRNYRDKFRGKFGPEF